MFEALKLKSNQGITGHLEGSSGGMMVSSALAWLTIHLWKCTWRPVSFFCFWRLWWPPAPPGPCWRAEMGTAARQTVASSRWWPPKWTRSSPEREAACWSIATSPETHSPVSSGSTPTESAWTRSQTVRPIAAVAFNHFSLFCLHQQNVTGHKARRESAYMTKIDLFRGLSFKNQSLLFMCSSEESCMMKFRILACRWGGPVWWTAAEFLMSGTWEESDKAAFVSERIQTLWTHIASVAFFPLRWLQQEQHFFRANDFLLSLFSRVQTRRRAAFFEVSPESTCWCLQKQTPTVFKKRIQLKGDNLCWTL